MAFFLQSTTEENLYLCILHRVWGAKTNKISHWSPGDEMIAYVERELAAHFVVTGNPYYSEEPIWTGDVYPYRVEIELKKIIAPENRYSISSADTREMLFKHHSSSYAVSVVLNPRPLHEDVASLLMSHMDESEAWYSFDATAALADVREQTEHERQQAVEEVVEARDDVAAEPSEKSKHTEMQYRLAILGRALGYDVWIPKADQGKIYAGVSLSELSIADLPALPYSDKVLRIIRNIDVIWLSDEHPSHLFEVEHTTSIYSGLLRMSDFTALIPSIQIEMYICADQRRKNQVFAEAARPTFEKQRAPLRERCRFLSDDKLIDFLEYQADFLRHFSTSILHELSDGIDPPPD